MAVSEASRSTVDAGTAGRDRTLVPYGGAGRVVLAVSRPSVALHGPEVQRDTPPLCGLCALSCIRGRALDGLPGASSIAESRGSVPGPIFSYFPNKSECVPVRYSMRVFPSTR